MYPLPRRVSGMIGDMFRIPDKSFDIADKSLDVTDKPLDHTYP